MRLNLYMNLIAFINNFLDYDLYLMNIPLIIMSTHLENVIL
ncbi:Peptide methionine sulfoxide reductase MsrA Protein-methionine-S-oxide reductase [Candidatus Micropelagos thuwalensis]|uniref:Peptide methionine sulfoxide reductase MsrA Protein-methionine-S-oxide reductase n=1 Tax=Candidatus Micropelagius thuwalensis TaxID=1397666 RepID=U2XVR0_9PROT|nr:Peptide methionine sulfoxide reductase MsrA Protein-methionine-S-oxide reductase [Candidatus Micropelagos thuwalensis]